MTIDTHSNRDIDSLIPLASACYSLPSLHIYNTEYTYVSIVFNSETLERTRKETVIALLDAGGKSRDVLEEGMRSVV